MDYVGKYAIQRRSANWIGLKYFKDKYANDKMTEIGYSVANLLHDFNVHPLSRHSTITMGAGDAAARYNIGMQRLAEEAFNEAMDMGVDIADFKKFQPKFEELFEKKIFRIKDVELDNGTTMKVKVVTDKLAQLGGDKATLTSNLDGVAKQFTNLLAALPGSSLFFKFITPAVNGLKITFDHTPAALLLNKRYHAMLRGDMVELEKLGITERTLPGQIAEIEGKVQFGMGLTVKAAKAADLLIYVTDDPEEIVPKEFKDRSFMVFNKCDLNPAPSSFSGLSVSAKTGEGIGVLLEKLKSLVTSSSGQKLNSERTHKKLEKAMKILSKEAGGADFFEMTAQNIRDANQELTEIYGELDNEKILDQIFNNFCIGK